MKMILVFVHGWSVTNVDTYGELPVRMRAEARARELNVEVKEIFLGKYISFHDEIRLEDIARAFQMAVKDNGLGKKKFACITHSTGGPVIRDWWHRYYADAKDECPLSHLIMLAPANFGSALAQLGKARVGRIKAWTSGVEPGQGVLDWLELGSMGGWRLNKDWILRGNERRKAKGFFPFVLTGQSIDRKLYDSLNNYTGEMGSDGVVRVAAANLHSRFIRLVQEPLDATAIKNKKSALTISEYFEAPKTPLRVLKGKSHSDTKMGIMASVKSGRGESGSAETVDSIFDCLNVSTEKDYTALIDKFSKETQRVQEEEQIETEERLLLTDRHFVHDRYSMVVFRVVDSEGYPVKDYDLIITAGKDSDPNLLPEGFLKDRQRNRINGENLTYYFNYDAMKGCDKVIKKKTKEIIRNAITGIDRLGLEIQPRPVEGFVHYFPCKIEANAELLEKALVPNSTSLVEICLQRIVYKEVFVLDELKGDRMPSKDQGNFEDTKRRNRIE